MMRRMLCLLLCLLGCTACSALPAEERSFAVALGISGGDGAWTVYARIPTYQSGGGYATVTGEGGTIRHALAALDAAVPMQLHLGQARLLVFAADTARTDSFREALLALAERPDLRAEASLAVTEADLSALMAALKPTAGQRLSKALDVLMQARIEEGTALSATAAETLLLGERQQGALMNVTLREGAVSIAGAWPVSAEGRVTQPLPPEDTQLLALMLGRLTAGTLTLTEGTLRLTDASAETELSLPTMQEAAVRLRLRVNASPLTEEAVSQAVATACLGLLGRLSAMGCDALGLGRQAVVHASDMAEWRAMDWPALYRNMAWSVSVGVTGATQ